MIKQQMINECLNLVRIGNRRLMNQLRSSTGESSSHIAMKESVCNKLNEDGHTFLCEAIFKTGGRADILVLDQFKVIEIAVSESDESLKEKEKYYPKGLDIEVIRC